MKIILIMICMLGVAESRMAIVGGANYSTIDGVESEVPEEYLEHFPGFRLGIENIGQGLLAGLTYSQRGFQASMDEGGDSASMSASFNYMTGYTLARIKLSSTLNLLLGPEVGYLMDIGMSNEYNGEENNETIDRDEWVDQGGNELDYGLVLGLRFTISPVLHAAATYYYGFANITDAVDSDGVVEEMKHRGFQFYLTYGL